MRILDTTKIYSQIVFAKQHIFFTTGPLKLAVYYFRTILKLNIYSIDMINKLYNYGHPFTPSFIHYSFFLECS